MVALERSSIEKMVNTRAGTVSREIFRSQDIYDQEMEQVFGRTWLFVGHESQIPNPYDYILSRMGEEAVIVTRDGDGKVHVLLNSCRHRGNRVCRYEEGNSRTHMCSFHGWSYDSTGALVSLPYNENGYDNMPMEEWGLKEARAEIFQGTIWACWDPEAPSFIDYLGGADFYLASQLMGTDGTDAGAEVLGGIVKWRLGCNWKVPSPDRDPTHAWITHRSLSLGLGVGPTGNPVNLQAGGQRTIGQRRSQWNVSFPEGHTMGIYIPEEGDPSWAENSIWADKPLVREYLREKFEIRKKKLGIKAYLQVEPAIFPNEGWLGRVIRIMHPNGPASTEIWTYFLVDKDAPLEVKDALASYYEHWYGPSGMTQQDDMENWYNLTIASKGPEARKLDLNYQMGLGTEVFHGPTKFGMPGLFAQRFSDETHRRFYQRWADCMQARDWGEMRPTESARMDY